VAVLLCDRILDSIEAYFALSPEMLALSVQLSGPPGRRLSLRAAREVVSDPTLLTADADAIWSQLVRRATGAGEPWQLALIWVMTPGLRRVCRRCRRYATLDARELEAVAVAGLIDAVHATEPDRPGLGGWLWWTTYRRVRRDCVRNIEESPTDDLDRAATRAGRRTAEAVPVALSLPAGRSGPVEPSTVEGERLGSVAYRLGLADDLPGPSTEKAA
jgi:hypothetical protein